LNPRHLFLALFLVLFAGLAAAVVLFFVDTRQEYVRLRTVNLENQRHLQEAEAELEQQETVLKRLRTDPAYVERVIRAKLGYAKPDEWIFRFNE
jgi:cell division protein DivIC